MNRHSKECANVSPVNIKKERIKTELLQFYIPLLPLINTSPKLLLSKFSTNSFAECKTTFM